MERNNWKPFIYALCIGLGILLGMLLQPSGTSSRLWQVSGGKLSELIQLIDQAYVDTVNVNELEETAIRKLLAELDPHSVYLAADELKQANQELEGSFEGIGVEFSILNDTLMVISPLNGGPSKELGIRPGDRIVAVDGETIAGVGITNEKVFKLLRGPKGTQVKVSIVRHGLTELLSFTITRNAIPVNSVDAALYLNEQTGYIKVSRFAAETHHEFETAIRKLQSEGKLNNLIVDVRGNPGGYLSAVIEMADQLLGNNELIVYTEGRSQPRYDYRCEKQGLFEKGKLIVLIDEGSASASEILAGAVQDHDRGIIIGRRSYGKGLVQEPFQMRDGSGLRLTVSRYYTPSGRCIQKPYIQGSDSYEHEIYDRFTSGELEQESAIPSSDSLKYYTRSGRPVFAGGGISPDVFVPIDTTLRSEYLSAVAAANLFNQFASWYTDRNRKMLNSYKNTAAFKTGFTNDLMKEFVPFVAERGVGIASEHHLNAYINNQLKALIARQLWRDEGYYSIHAAFDKTILKALDVLNQYDSILKPERK